MCFLSKLLQLCGESQYQLNIATRPDGREEYAHGIILLGFCFG